MHLKFFPSLFEQPTKVSFVQQEEGEQIILLLRRHWATNLIWIFTSLVLILVPFIIPKVLPYIIRGVLVPVDVQMMFLTIWYLLVLAYIIEKFLFWYFNIYIL